MLRKRKPQGTPKTTTGSVFSSKTVKPAVSFAAALRGHPEEQTRKEAAPHPRATKPSTTSEQTGQSVLAPPVNNVNVDMYNVIPVVQQIMTDHKDAVSEEAKILAITKIVFNLMKNNGK
jgi:hypothetical protein